MPRPRGPRRAATAAATSSTARYLPHIFLLLLLAVFGPAPARGFVFSFFQPYSVALGPEPRSSGGACAAGSGGGGGGGGGGWPCLSAAGGSDSCPPTLYSGVDNGACLSIAGIDAFGARVVCTSLTQISYGVCASSDCLGCIAFAGDTGAADSACIPVGAEQFLAVTCGPGPALIFVFVLASLAGLVLLACVCCCIWCPKPHAEKEAAAAAAGGAAAYGGLEGLEESLLPLEQPLLLLEQPLLPGGERAEGAEPGKR